MAKTTNKLTDFQKTRIIAAYESETSIKQCADALGLKLSTCTSFYSRFMKYFNLPPKLKFNKSKISAAMGIAIKKLVRDHPQLGLRAYVGKLKEELPDESWYPSKETIRVFLKNNGKIKKKHVLKPFISEANRIKRLQYATKYVGDSSDRLGVVIWTDETMVRSHPFTRRHSSWVEANEKAPLQEKHHTGKHSVMFWGCISSLGRGSLVVIDGNMNEKKYMKVLREELLPEATAAYDNGISVKVMHDNAPCHKSNSIKAYINNSGVEFLVWPPYSPDLNPIENVWAWIKWKLYTEFPPAQTKDELIEYVFKCWESLDREKCQKYCNGYNKRLLAVLEADGLQTKY